MSIEVELLKVKQSLREPKYSRVTGTEYWYDVVLCKVMPDRRMPDIGRPGPLVNSLTEVRSYDLDILSREGVHIEIETVEGSPESRHLKGRTFWA
ncbi:MAG: hypothetical protein AAB683_00820 [Patescibacteria group bacterium]